MMRPRWRRLPLWALVLSATLLQCSGKDRGDFVRRDLLKRVIAKAGVGVAFCTISTRCRDAVASCFAITASGRATRCEKDEKFLRCSDSSFACCDKEGNALATEIESDARARCDHR